MRIFPHFLMVAVVAVVASFAPAAYAAVYRCVGEDGHVSYQQIRCHSTDKPMVLKGRPSGWSPLRPGEQALLDRYRKKDAAQRRKPYVERKISTEASRSCWERQKQLEAVRAKLRRGYTLKEDEALHRKRDNYQDYLRKFCS